MQTGEMVRPYPAQSKEEKATELPATFAVNPLASCRLIKLRPQGKNRHLLDLRILAIETVNHSDESKMWAALFAHFITAGKVKLAALAPGTWTRATCAWP